jgi:hypothetical protein
MSKISDFFSVQMDLLRGAQNFCRLKAFDVQSHIFLGGCFFSSFLTKGFQNINANKLSFCFGPF